MHYTPDEVLNLTLPQTEELFEAVARVETAKSGTEGKEIPPEEFPGIGIDKANG